MRRRNKGRKKRFGEVKLGSEKLEQRLALSATTGPDVDPDTGEYQRPELLPATSIDLRPGKWGPAPINIGIDSLRASVDGDSSAGMSFLVKNVANGVVEKWNGQTWQNVAQKPRSSSPADLAAWLALRQIKPTDQIRWVPDIKASDTSLKAFKVVGWDGSTLTNEDSDVDFSVPTLSEDIVLRHESVGAVFSISETGRVIVETDASENVDWYSETSDVGTNSIGFLLETFEQLSDSSEYKRAGVTFANGEGTEDDQFLILNLTGSPELTTEGRFRLVGQLEGDISSDSDLVDIVGDQFALGNDQYNNNYSVCNELTVNGGVQIWVDTLTVAETKEYVQKPLNELEGSGVVGSDAFLGSQKSSGVQDEFENFSPSNLELSHRFDFVDKTIGTGRRNNPPSVQFYAGAEPGVMISFDPPDGWWDKLCAPRYVVTFEATLGWNAFVDLQTGATDGRFTVEENRWEPNLNIPRVPITALPGASVGFTPFIDYSATVALPQLRDSYKWEVSQDLGFGIKIGDPNASCWSTPLNHVNSYSGSSAPAGSSLPQDQSIQKNFPQIVIPNAIAATAMLKPGVRFDAGYVAPQSIPFVGGESIVTVNADVGLPIDISAFYNWGRSADREDWLNQNPTNVSADYDNYDALESVNLGRGPLNGSTTEPQRQVNFTRRARDGINLSMAMLADETHAPTDMDMSVARSSANFLAHGRPGGLTGWRGSGWRGRSVGTIDNAWVSAAVTLDFSVDFLTFLNGGDGWSIDIGETITLAEYHSGHIF